MLLSSCCQYLRLLVRTSVQISDSNIRFGYLILNSVLISMISPKSMCYSIAKVSKCLGAQHRPSRCRHASLPVMMNTFLGFNGVSLLFFSPGATIFSSVQNPISSIVSHNDFLWCITIAPALYVSVYTVSVCVFVHC